MAGADTTTRLRPSIDRRTRVLGDVSPMTAAEAVARFGDGPTRQMAAAAQRALSLPPLSLDVDGDRCTIDDGRVVVGPVPGALVTSVTAAQLGALVAGAVGIVQLHPEGPRGAYRPGERAWLLWHHAIAALFQGRPLHGPGDPLPFLDRAGAPLDLGHSFDPSADDLDIAHFLAETGFAHLRGWVDQSALTDVERDVHGASAAMPRSEPHHVWTRTPAGDERCVRIRHLLRWAPAMAGLVAGPVYRRLAGLYDDGHALDTDLPYSCEALIKPAERLVTMTDLPWHRDCGSVGCELRCANYAVGLPLGPTDEEVGMLQVVAGSHRASTPAPGLGYDSGLPLVSLRTEPGDLTLHLPCTLHGTVTSVASERVVVYTTFTLPEAGQPLY